MIANTLMTKNIYKSTSQLMKEHQWEKVLKILDSKTLEENKSWKLLWNLAWSYYKLDKFAEALDKFHKAAEYATDEKDKAICLTFMGITELQLEKFDNALKYLQDSLLIEDSTLTRKSLALALMHLDDFKSAQKIHEEGLKLKPKNKERLAAFGDFLLDMGMVNEAEEIKRRLAELH